MSSTVQVFVKLIDTDLDFSHFPFLITERGSKNYYAFVLQKKTKQKKKQLPYTTANYQLQDAYCVLPPVKILSAYRHILPGNFELCSCLCASVNRNNKSIGI